MHVCRECECVCLPAEPDDPIVSRCEEVSLCGYMCEDSVVGIGCRVVPCNSAINFTAVGKELSLSLFVLGLMFLYNFPEIIQKHGSRTNNALVVWSLQQFVWPSSGLRQCKQSRSGYNSLHCPHHPV